MKRDVKSLFGKYKKNIPNILTTLRLIAVPVFWILTLNGNPLPAAILFGSACATDALDGYLARRWQSESIYGKITDPMADKMLVMSALLLNGITSNHVMLLPFGLEMGIAVTNLKDFFNETNPRLLLNMEYIKDLIENKNKVRVSQTGREKTIALMTTVSLGLINSGLKLPYEYVVNIFTFITASIEAATLTEYIDAKIINKESAQMRIPKFQESINKVNNVNEKETELTINEKINILNKEKELLTQNETIQKLSKTKDFK